MMSPVDPEAEPGSPRSDSGDSAQWCVVSPEVKSQNPRRLAPPPTTSGNLSQRSRCAKKVCLSILHSHHSLRGVLGLSSFDGNHVDFTLTDLFCIPSSYG